MLRARPHVRAVSDLTVENWLRRRNRESEQPVPMSTLWRVTSTIDLFTQIARIFVFRVNNSVKLWQFVDATTYDMHSLSIISTWCASQVHIVHLIYELLLFIYILHDTIIVLHHVCTDLFA